MKELRLLKTSMDKKVEELNHLQKQRDVQKQTIEAWKKRHQKVEEKAQGLQQRLDESIANERAAVQGLEQERSAHQKLKEESEKERALLQQMRALLQLKS